MQMESNVYHGIHSGYSMLLGCGRHVSTEVALLPMDELNDDEQKREIQLMHRRTSGTMLSVKVGRACMRASLAEWQWL